MDKDSMEFGKFYKRPHWNKLCVYVDLANISIPSAGIWPGDDIYRYYEDGTRTGGLASSTMDNMDFVECDINAEPIKAENKIKEIDMGKNVNYIGGEYKLVECEYVGGGIGVRVYIFKADIDLELEREDIIVVESKNGLGLCMVHDVHEDNIENVKLAERATAWVVDRVDMAKHKKKQEATERLKYVKAKLKEKSEQMETIKMYALLADLDPEAKKLVDEMKQLTNMGVKDEQ